MAKNKNINEETIEFYIFFRAISKHLFLIAASVLVGFLAAFIANKVMPVKYKASVLMLIDRENTGKMEQFSLNNISAWYTNEEYYRTQYKLFESRTFLEAAYKELELEKRPDFAGGWQRLAGMISVKPLTRSRMVNVEVSAKNPQLAADIANAVARTYTAQNIDNRFFMAREVVAALESKEKSKAEQEILDSLPQIVNSDIIKYLKREEASIKINYEKLLGKYTVNHPDVISVARQLRAIRAIIEKEKKRIIQSIKLQLSGQFAANNVRIIDEAVVPKRPYSPRKSLNMLIGVGAGLIIGIIIALFIEFLDRTIKDASDIEKKLNLKFLGPIAKINQILTLSDYHSILKDGNEILAENVRNVQTMLSLAMKSRRINSFIVTSSVQHEGKSFIAANIAEAFANAGKNTLLIDGDIRDGAQHEIFGLPEHKGLSDYLSGETEGDLHSLILDTEVKGLSLLPSGTCHTNISLMLDPDKLKKAVDSLKYDVIIADCPAILPLSDSLIWGQVISNSVFVIKQNTVPVSTALFAIERIQQSDMSIIGVVMNDCYDYIGLKGVY